ncbi:uncharacterized protein C8Q71DRAFT_761724 [Rhodofomes roseus]|uniref:Uncharacterized protein n=1 Tax=Rhodofomes roseus TaxID=34475 RepID=A0ABQ8KEX5_9APHY|nr:uncharacterized protein C8Q71DRAFT_761724 [Rhodofomes roseus]KAH9836294.1 hypothetical protein C8Q71DRAFT_761724 [Rhodofomes roseus]
MFCQDASYDTVVESAVRRSCHPTWLPAEGHGLRDASEWHTYGAVSGSEQCKAPRTCTCAWAWLGLEADWRYIMGMFSRKTSCTCTAYNRVSVRTFHSYREDRDALVPSAHLLWSSSQSPPVMPKQSRTINAPPRLPPYGGPHSTQSLCRLACRTAAGSSNRGYLLVTSLLVIEDISLADGRTSVGAGAKMSLPRSRSTAHVCAR